MARWASRIGACGLVLVAAGLASRAVVAAWPAGPIRSADPLVRMTGPELQWLYRQSCGVAMPSGKVRGTPLVAPGTRHAPLLALGARMLWQGKVFHPSEGDAINRFLGVRIIRGEVYQGPSWLDGRPALILDYSRTSHVYARYRDEIRPVGPGAYLGLMFDRTTCPPRLTTYFALEDRP